MRNHWTRLIVTNGLRARMAAVVLFAVGSLPAGYTSAASPPDQSGRAYLQHVLARAYDCQTRGGATAACFTQASPKRCTQAAIHMVSSTGDATWDQSRHTWATCVESCATASTWSKTFGDCRHG